MNKDKKQNNDNHAKKEALMGEDFVYKIMKQEGYKEITENENISKVKNTDFLKNKFSCHYDLEEFNKFKPDDQHMITGFGPTNAPTGGTLSMILRAIFFERETGVDSTIIISNLGAFNSRNIPIEKIDYLTQRFIKFIRLLGFKGDVRTHNNLDMLVSSGLISKVLKIKDFVENEEATTDLYKSLGLQGDDFSTFVDESYTVSDILLPCILNKKKRVLVFVGIEEYYFPKLANLVLSRFKNKYPDQFVDKESYVSAVFGQLISGLNGYPKMSKSIKDSSINLDDNEEGLKEKIINCKKEDDEIILQMINLVSDWEIDKLNLVNNSFKKMDNDWLRAKEEYYKYFLDIKKKWDQTEIIDYKFDVKNLFKNERD